MAGVKRFHALICGSADARSIANVVINEGYPLSRYRARSLMNELDLVSCQIPKHKYKMRIKIIEPSQLYLNVNSLLLSLILIGVAM